MESRKRPRLRVSVMRHGLVAYLLSLLIGVGLCSPCQAATAVLIEPAPASRNTLGVDGNLRFGPVLPAQDEGHISRIDLRANALQHERVGEEFMDRGYYARAIEAFQVALGLNPDSRFSASVYHNLALCYRALNQFPLAIMSHQRAMRLAPGFAMYGFHLARTYQAAGIADVAYQRFSALLDQDPDNVELQRLVNYLK